MLFCENNSVDLNYAAMGGNKKPSRLIEMAVVGVPHGNKFSLDLSDVVYMLYL